MELNAAINQRKDSTTIINETTVETTAPDHKKLPVVLKSHKTRDIEIRVQTKFQSSKISTPLIGNYGVKFLSNFLFSRDLISGMSETILQAPRDSPVLKLVHFPRSLNLFASIQFIPLDGERTLSRSPRL